MTLIIYISSKRTAYTYNILEIQNIHVLLNSSPIRGVMTFTTYNISNQRAIYFSLTSTCSQGFVLQKPLMFLEFEKVFFDNLRRFQHFKRFQKKMEGKTIVFEFLKRRFLVRFGYIFSHRITNLHVSRKQTYTKYNFKSFYPSQIKPGLLNIICSTSCAIDNYLVKKSQSRTS